MDNLLQDQPPQPPMTVGEYAYGLIRQHYRLMVKQKKAVLVGQASEPLHDMRVEARRLRTVLRVFADAVDLPKAASVRRVADLARGLGRLRDLDVQMETLQTRYGPKLGTGEQSVLREVLAELAQRRQRRLTKITRMLQRSPYQALKTAYQDWLVKPQYGRMAAFPLVVALPHLISPDLAKLLLHPGWQIAATGLTPTHSPVLHDLRKAGKGMRYQMEFFQEFYGSNAQVWLRQLKSVQEILGRVQDGDVLRALLAEILPQRRQCPDLHTLIALECAEAMAHWDALRAPYLDPEFQRSLYLMVLEPTQPEHSA